MIKMVLMDKSVLNLILYLYQIPCPYNPDTILFYQSNYLSIMINLNDIPLLICLMFDYFDRQYFILDIIVCLFCSFRVLSVY